MMFTFFTAWSLQIIKLWGLRGGGGKMFGANGFDHYLLWVSSKP